MKACATNTSIDDLDRLAKGFVYWEKNNPGLNLVILTICKRERHRSVAVVSRFVSSFIPISRDM